LVTGGRSAAWNGDYTIDYNFQANFWGAVSSNRASFVATYTDSITSLLPLGRMRAAAPSWHEGRGFFGPSGQYSQGMQCGHSPTGWSGPLGQCPVEAGLGNYSGVNFPGHFGPYVESIPVCKHEQCVRPCTSCHASDSVYPIPPLFVDNNTAVNTDLCCSHRLVSTAQMEHLLLTKRHVRVFLVYQNSSLCVSHSGS